MKVIREITRIMYVEDRLSAQVPTLERNVVANTSPELHPNLLHKNLRTLESQYYITISYGVFA